MPHITLDTLRSDHLDIFGTITAETSTGLAQLVWDRRRLPVTLTRTDQSDLIADRQGDLVQHATIDVQSLDANELEPIFAKIEALDRHARRRVVRG